MTYEVTIRDTIRDRLFLKKEIERTIGFKFTIETWMLLSDYTQVAPSDFGLIEQESFLIKTCYCACKLWHLEKGQKVDFNEDDIKRWIEECMTMKQGKELIETMFKSRIGGESIENLIPKYLEELKKEAEKKKSRGMKSKTLQSE